MICSRNECTGCGACFNICPKGAITMLENEYGFSYPEIDSKKCINCGLCKKSCPQLSLEKLNWHAPKEVYAMYSRNYAINKASTSGGMARTFYENIIKLKGIAYGCNNINKDAKIEFIRVDKIEDLQLLQGSKYVQANINDMFIQVKKDILNNRKVIFIGTPCQVAGLKAFLNKEYENIFLIDIICHGVPSQKLLFEDLQSNDIDISKATKIIFREGKNYKIKVYDGAKEIFCQPANKNNYLINFLKGRISRESCYNCKFATSSRISDITIGDYWGLDKRCKIANMKNDGISLVMINSNKGKELINICKNEINIEKRNFEEASKENSQLNYPTKENKEHITFLKMYPKYGYKKTMTKIEDIKDKIKKVEIINRIYLRIKK